MRLRKNVWKKSLSLLLALMMVIGMVPGVAFATDDTYDSGEAANVDATQASDTSYVAKIGETGYDAFADALTAASAMTGDVVVEIYNKVTLNTSLSGSYDSIKFVGKATDAEIYLDVQGYITATGKKVAFEDLTLSKSEGGFITNAGFMNVAFGVYDVAEVTYTSCTFTNGAYAGSGEVTFTGCTFYRSHDKYGLWAYGDVDCTVTGCTFADYRGIKMYAEGAAKTVALTVTNTSFSSVTDKPAIVLTYGESVTLENNTYSSTGVFELDLDGAPNGTTVTSDVAPTCKNDNGACGVLVDGKIYTTVAQAAAAATSGSTVTLLHDSTETVEFAEGVTLNKNGFTASNVTVVEGAAPAPAGGVPYAYVGATTIWGQTWSNATKSYELKFYNGETLMGTSALNTNLDVPMDGDVEVTWHISFDPSTDTDSYWIQSWTVTPTAANFPNRVELWVDGVKVNESTVQFNGPDNLNRIAALAEKDGKLVGAYTDLQEAIKAAAPNGTVELLSDVTVDTWIQFAQSDAQGEGKVIRLDMDGLTIDGNGYTVTINDVESAQNGDSLFRDAKEINIHDITFKMVQKDQGGIDFESGTISNVTFDNGSAIFPGNGEITITGCTFKTDGHCFYYEGARENLTVTGNTFEISSADNVILLYGGETFTNNTVKSGRTVNVVSGSPTVTGNNFNDVRLKVYNEATATISNNTINNLLFNDETVAQSTFTSNTLSTEAEAALEAVQPAAPLELGRGYISLDPATEGRYRVYAEVLNVSAQQSISFELYSGTTLVGTTSLNSENYSFPYSNSELGMNMVISGKASSSWNTVWTEGMPRADLVPDKLVLFIDGEKAAESVVVVGNIDNLGTPLVWTEIPGVNPAPVTDVARIGDTTYATLGEAIAAAKDGDTITLLTDVTPTANEFWELNGKTNITLTAAEGVVINGSVSVGYHSSHTDSDVNRSNSTLTVDGLTVNGTLTVCSNDAAVVVSDNAAAQITVKTYREGMKISVAGNTMDGKLGTAANSYGLFVVPNATGYDLSMTGNTFKNIANHASVIQGCGDGTAVTAANSIVVTSNTFESWGTNGKEARAAFKIWADTKYAPAEGDLTEAMRELVKAIADGNNAFNSTANNTVQFDAYGAAGNAEDFVVAPAVKTYEVSTKAELNDALAAVQEGEIILLTADIDYGTDQLKIEKAITLDLGDKTLTTRNAYGGMSVKNGPTIKNGTIVHASNTAAIKVWNATAFENLVIDVQGKGDANKTIGGIVLQSGSTTCVGSIKNVTIKGEALTNGIETYNCGDAEEDVIGSMENVNIDAVGTAMLISAPVGTATGCTFDGGVNGIELWIKGTYSASLTLVDCDVVGGVFAHDEFNSNPGIVNNGDLSLSVDAATTGVTAETVTLTINHAEESQVKGEVLETIIESAQAKVNGTYYATLADAIKAAQAGDTVTVFAGTYAVPSMKAGITVVGETDSEGNPAVVLEGTLSGTLENLTLKNLHIKGSNAQRWAYAKGDLVFENVTFEATSVYALHFDGITEGTTLLYKDCTIIGWAAMGGSPASCTFDGCTFEDNGTYGLIRTFFDATIKNCTFDVDGANPDDVYQDGIHATSGATIQVNNCTNVNGEMKDVLNISGESKIYVDGVLALAPVVAKVGEDGYFTLQAAIAAAADGETVTVLSDITIAENIQIPGTVTLDLNGKTISLNGSKLLEATGTLTIQDSSAEKTGKIQNIAEHGQNAIRVGEGAKVILNSGSLSATYYTVFLNANSTFVMNGGSVSATGFVGIIGNGSYDGTTITINGGTVEGTECAIYHPQNGTLTITDGTIKATASGNASATAIYMKSGTLTISGGNVSSVGGVKSEYTADNSGCYPTGDAVVIENVGGETGYEAVTSVSITGGKFYSEKASAIASYTAGNEGVEAVTGFISGGQFSDVSVIEYLADGYVLGTNSSGYYKVELSNSSYVAIVNGKEYTSLQTAVNDAPVGAVIFIKNDFALNSTVTVPDGKNITIDLNGKTISGTDNNTSGNFYLINNVGTLTIKDSVGGGKITLKAENDRDWNSSSVVVANNPGGKLTVESGTIKHLGGTDMAYAIDNLTNGKGTYAETIIEGGTVKSTYRAVRQFLNGIEAQNILTVNGGTIEGANKSIWMQDPSKNANTGTLTVAATATLNGDVYLTVTEGSTEWPVEVSIDADALAEGSEVLTSNVPAGYAVKEMNGVYGVLSLKGTGTAEDPYLISNVDELILFRDSVNAGKNYAGKYVQLIENIDLTSVENWEPIGNVGYGTDYAPVDASKAFSGTFDGNGKFISNLKIEKILNGGADAEANLGLFGITGEGAVIKDLTLTNVTINTDGRNVGALVAFAYKAALENITVNGNIQIMGGNNVSGVCAMSRYNTVSATNIKVVGNDGSKIVGNNIVGGIFAEIAPNGTEQTFKDLSVANVAISGTSGVGGIVGLLTLGTVENVSVKNVTLTGKTEYQGDAMGRIRLGAVAGLLGSNYATIKSAAVENVTAKNLDGNVVELPIIGANYSGSIGNATEAKIGDTYYATLAIAVSEAQQGDTIVLLENITLTQTVHIKKGDKVTLDLNGKTVDYDPAVWVYGAANSGTALITVDFGGELTIKDTSEDKTGTLDASYNDDSFGLDVYDVYSAVMMTGKGDDPANGTAKLTVESGTLIGYFAAIAGNKDRDNTEITINGGTVKANISEFSTAGIEHPMNGKLTVTGGTIEGMDGISMRSGTLLISGGTIIGNAPVDAFDNDGYWNNDFAACTGNALQIVSRASVNSAFETPTVTITGGTFISANAAPVASYAVTVAEAVTGFIGTDFTGTLKGAEAPADHIAIKDYAFASNGDGTWSLVVAGLTGSGTESAPYLIKTVEDLIFFRDSVNAGETKYNASDVYVALAADIDLAGINWVGIGSINQEHGFMGNFDGNGYKIKNLTITDPVLVGGYAYAGLFSITEGTDENNQNIIKNLTIENVTISTTGHIVAAAVAYPYYTTLDNIKVCGNISITGGDYTAGVVAYTRRCTDASNLTIAGNAGSTVTGRYTVGGVIADIQMNGGLTANYSNFSASGLTVKGENCVGGISGIISGQTLSTCKVENVTLVCSDARVGTVSGALGDPSTITNAAVANVTGASALIGGAYDGGKAVVAKVGNTYYNDLQNAIDNANGVSVEMLAPITVANGETLVIDLKGQTVVGTDNATGSFGLITNHGTLTIKDSSEAKTGKITLTATNDRGWSAYSSVISNNPGGKLTVESGTIEHLGGTDMAYGIDNLTNGKGTYAETIINGGTVKSTYRAIRQFLNGIEAQNILTVNGGTIEGANKAIWFQDPSAKANTGTLTVGANATLNGDVYLTVTEGSTEWPVEVSIASAALNGESTVVTSNVPEGYVVDKVDGVWTVRAANYVAEVNDKKYETFDEAIAQIATDGSDTTIKLLADIELTESVQFVYGTGKIVFTADAPVTVKQTKNKLDILFVDAKAANIVIEKNVTFEISDNASGMYLYYGPSLTVNGTVTGGANWGCLYLFNGTHIVSETGKVVVGRLQVAYNTVTVYGEVDTNYLLVEDGTFIADSAVIDANVIYDNNNGGQRWGASEFVFKNGTTVNTSKLTLSYADSVLTIDTTSTITAATVVGAGKIVIDATGFTGESVQVIEADMSDFTGTVEVINGEDYKVVVDETGIALQAKNISGKIAYRAYVEDNADREAVKVALQNVYAKESVVVKLYDAEGNLLTTTALKAGAFEGEWLTTNIVLAGTPSGSWNTEISAEKLTVANYPDKIELYIDSNLMDTFETALGNSTDAAVYQLPAYLNLDCVYKAAMVGDTYYATLDEALDAPQVTEITLMGDIDEDIVINQAVTIILNGKDIADTVTVADGYEFTKATEKWTVTAVNYVAEVNGVQYKTVTEALNAAAATCASVTMTADATENAIMVPAGVTLDLNGKTLTAGYVFATGDIYDNTLGSGKLTVSANSVALNSNNTLLPLYDGTSYRFTVVVTDVKIAEENGALKYSFFFRLANKNTAERTEFTNILIEALETSQIKLYAHVGWTGELGPIGQNYVVGDSFVDSMQKNNKYVTLSFIGYENLGDLEFSCSVACEGAMFTVEKSFGELPYTNTNE